MNRASDLLPALENGLGSTDSGIREGSLDILWELVESGALSGGLMLEMGERLTKCLMTGFGEEGSDSVFLRTFSALIAGLITAQDELQFRADGTSFLPARVYESWYDRVMEYAGKERDFRDYVPGKGWAHAVSHTADLLRDFAFHRYSGKEHHKEILQFIASRFSRLDNLVFINNDDNRMVRIVIVIMHRGLLDMEDYKGWIQDALQTFGGKCLLDFADDRKQSTLWFNFTTFLRALYFTLVFGMENLKDIPLFDKIPKYSSEMESLILQTPENMDGGLNYAPFQTSIKYKKKES